MSGQLKFSVLPLQPLPNTSSRYPTALPLPAPVLGQPLEPPHPDGHSAPASLQACCSSKALLAWVHSQCLLTEGMNTIFYPSTVVIDNRYKSIIFPKRRKVIFAINVPSKDGNPCLLHT